MLTKIPPQIELNMPIMFSAMSYGSIPKNAHDALARAAEKLGILYNTGEGGLHKDFYKYGKNTTVHVASGRFGVHLDYLNAGAAIEIKIGQGAKPGIGGHLPGKGGFWNEETKFCVFCRGLVCVLSAAFRSASAGGGGIHRELQQ